MKKKSKGVSPMLATSSQKEMHGLLIMKSYLAMSMNIKGTLVFMMEFYKNYIRDRPNLSIVFLVC